MNILLRTDASAAIGLGHAMRCLALAQAAHDHGHSTLFAAALLDPAMEQRLRDERCEIRTIPAQPGSREDAVETGKLARAYAAQWIVVDGYRFDAAYQKAIRTSGIPLLFLDDYGHGAPHVADLILNQNSYALRHPEWYEGRSPQSRVLLGCSYVLLRREFRTSVPRPHSPAIASRVLVTMGGGDPKNATLTIMEALRNVEDAPLDTTVVIGGANPHVKKVQAARGNIHVIMDSQDMPALMADADCAIAAGGTTAYELAYMGVPALLTILAENQRPVAEDFADQGVSPLLGDPATMPLQKTTRMISEFLHNREKRTDCSQKGRALVDGRGTERILETMTDML